MSAASPRATRSSFRIISTPTAAIVLTAVEHSASIEGTYSTNQNVSLKYHNRFRCIPDRPALPPAARRSPSRDLRHADGRRRRQRRVDGNRHRQIRPREGAIFLGSRRQKTLDSSCWIRVAQCWAGKRWGTFFLPRVKDEVIVAFEEGDPDRPIIVGSVYNDDQLPPYDLPDNKTRSTIKTRSSEKGTTDNFNEIRFEDKKDSEEIFIHAEKDYEPRGGKQRHAESRLRQEEKRRSNDRASTTIAPSTLDQGNESFTVKKGHPHRHRQGRRQHEVQSGNLTVKSIRATPATRSRKANARSRRSSRSSSSSAKPRSSSRRPA